MYSAVNSLAAFPPLGVIPIRANWPFLPVGNTNGVLPILRTGPLMKLFTFPEVVVAPLLMVTNADEDELMFPRVRVRSVSPPSAIIKLLVRFTAPAGLFITNRLNDCPAALVMD